MQHNASAFVPGTRVRLSVDTGHATTGVIDNPDTRDDGQTMWVVDFDNGATLTLPQSILVPVCESYGSRCRLDADRIVTYEDRSDGPDGWTVESFNLCDEHATQAFDGISRDPRLTWLPSEPVRLPSKATA